jgi:hypothetical protein
MGCLTIRPAPPAGADPLGLVPAWRFLFVPQSWAISIELLFYLVVPWLVSWGPGTCSCWPARASCPISPTAFLCIRPCPIYVCHILVKWGLLALAGVSKKGWPTAGLAAVARGNRAVRPVVVAGGLSD